VNELEVNELVGLLCQEDQTQTHRYTTFGENMDKIWWHGFVAHGVHM